MALALLPAAFNSALAAAARHAAPPADTAPAVEAAFAALGIATPAAGTDARPVEETGAQPRPNSARLVLAPRQYAAVLAAARRALPRRADVRGIVQAALAAAGLLVPPPDPAAGPDGPDRCTALWAAADGQWQQCTVRHAGGPRGKQHAAVTGGGRARWRDSDPDAVAPALPTQEPAGHPPAPGALAEALVSADPLVRYRAAQAAVAYFAGMRGQALRAVVAVHGGDLSAAAAALGTSPRDLAGHVHGDGPQYPRAALGQAQPALNLLRDEAYAALHAYAWAAQSHGDHRDHLVLGALAAGVGAHEIWEITAIPPEEIEGLLPSGPIEVAADLNPELERTQEVLHATALALHAYAVDLATAPGVDPSVADQWYRAAGSFARHCSITALHDIRWHGARDGEGSSDTAARAPGTVDPVTGTRRPDAWLAAQVVRLRRDADAVRSGAAGLQAVAAAVLDAIADAYTCLRRTGTVPALPDPARWKS